MNTKLKSDNEFEFDDLDLPEKWILSRLSKMVHNYKFGISDNIGYILLKVNNLKLLVTTNFLMIL